MPGGEVMRTTYDQVYDVAIIGGGSAGLSAALILARARRSVVVIDGGTPRNAPASAAHGLLGQEGDRKSTRLNSSHVAISYAVFCLKKKKNQQIDRLRGLD